VYKGVARDPTGGFPGKHEKCLIVKRVTEQTQWTSKKREAARSLGLWSKQDVFSVVCTAQGKEVAIYVQLCPVNNTNSHAQCPSKL
jgi:hypothetical protein